LTGTTGTYLLEINVSRRQKDVGIENREASDGTVIYPNPAQNSITISGLSGNEDIILTDINGRTLSTYTANGSTDIQLPVNSLSSGMYFVQISSSTATKTVKIVKE
jgi:hypothetical protein